MIQRDSRVCIVGLGYIGLPTATILASGGSMVFGFDVNPNIVETINRGEVHFVEPGLKDLVKSAVSDGRLVADVAPVEADVFVIAVPTPFKGEHEPDLSYVENAAKSIAPFLKKGSLVILESTSPVGTTEMVAQWLQQSRTDLKVPKYLEEEGDIHLAYCPERVLPGKVIHELITNDRVVGGINESSSRAARSFYGLFVKGKCHCTDSRTAEMVKLTENSFRDVNIAFANELSLLCDRFKINVWELINLANQHPRVNILNPGPGVGGHCISVDPWFIVHQAPDLARMIKTARQVNDSKPSYVLQEIRKKASKISNPVVAFLGLSFKANIDDFRESPALEIAREYASDSLGKTIIVEPYLKQLPGKLLEKAELKSLDFAIQEADILVLLVDHDEFKTVDPSIARNKVVIDTRGVWQ